MSFHTFEARKRKKLCEFNQVKDRIFDYCKKHNKRIYLEKDNDPVFTPDIKIENQNCKPFRVASVRKDVWICDALADKGIIIKLVQYITGDSDGNVLSWYNGIWFRVNPRRVIDDNNYVGIFEVKDVEKMLERANTLIKGVSWMMPPLDECILARLDFCRNVYIKFQDLVEMYIDMIKRCNIPPGFVMEKFFDEKLRKKVYSIDGIKLSMGSLAIIVYNKMAQMLKQDYPYPDIQAAEGIIRFEIQAYYNKIYNLGKKKGIKSLRDFLNQGDKFAAQQFNQYLPKIFCTGGYYSYEVAEKKIRQSDNMEKTKKGMLEFLKKTSTHKSLYKAIKDMADDDYSKTQITLLIRKFNELDLNPCTLPRRWQVENGLPNPIMLVSTP